MIQQVLSTSREQELLKCGAKRCFEMLRLIQNIGKASFHLSDKGVQKLYLGALSVDIKIEMALLQKRVEVENMQYMLILHNGISPCTGPMGPWFQNISRKPLLATKARIASCLGISRCVL